MKRLKRTKQAKEAIPPERAKKDKMATIYEKLQAAVSNMKAEQVKAEVQRIQAEKVKRYEYHKKYNLKKKTYEAKLAEKAKELGLLK
jgi:hypothetical protein